jgi:syntaxin 16
MKYSRRLRALEERQLNRSANTSGSTESDSMEISRSGSVDSLALQDPAHDFAKERKREVESLMKNLSDLAVIFKELSTLTIHQGTILDRIDHNVFETKEESEKAIESLQTAEVEQKRSGFSAVILLLVALVLLFIVIFVYKEI